MYRNHIKLKLLIAAILLLHSCQGQGERQATAPNSSVEIAKDVEAAPQPPEQISDTLLLEGMPEAVQLQLYQSPDAWPVQFYTYLPPNFKVSSTEAGEEAGLRFAFNEAELFLYLLPEGTNNETVQTMAKQALGSESVEMCDTQWSWQEACFYATDTPDVVSKVFIGEQQNRYFYFLIRFPAEYGDGFGPRYHMILNHWVWKE